ncbi:MAG: 50S ribosomal protein L25 [Chitinispirillales bacterium]|nr:50S ribosomal protein L25 [Chitinispirillales bacterium]
MEIVKLQAREREGTGKSYTRKTRAQGWIPAVYYGHDREPKKIEVFHKDFAAIVRGRKTNHLMDLGLAADSIAVIREVQRHVLKDSIFFNIDFMHINMNEKVTVDVPLIFQGVSVGVKDDNGVLSHPHKTVKVECLPADIPDSIAIDVSKLKIGDSIHVRDISIPNLTFKFAPEEALASVTHPIREVAAEKSAEEAAAPAVAPKGKAAKPAK